MAQTSAFSKVNGSIWQILAAVGDAVAVEDPFSEGAIIISIRS